MITVVDQSIQQSAHRKNPFKGASTYSERDERNFYGRDKEKNDMIGLISQHTLSLLYSRSGIGKSSLIHAGIIPILKKMKGYFPVYIRISDSLINENIKNFATAVIELIKHAADANEVLVFSNKKMPVNPTITDFLYLTEFHHSTEMLRGRKLHVSPVLIFDQFEEIFSANFKNDRPKDLVDDLSNVIECKIPKSLEDIFYEPNSPTVEEELYYLKDKLQSSKWYRILFCFREEYLPRFESLKNEIPSLVYTTGRYHLESFSVNTAYEVIHAISAESIEIDHETGKHLASLISKAERDPSGFDNEVQPFLLSLICKNIYQKIAGPRAKKEVIDAVRKEDISLVDHIIEEYVSEVFVHISPATKNFIEDQLITDDDKRTMYPLSNLNNSAIKAELKLLYTSAELRFLNLVEYFNTSHVEILHDRLLKPLLASRKLRGVTKARNKLIKTVSAFSAVLIVLLLFFINEKRETSKYDEYFQKTKQGHINRMQTNLLKDSMNNLRPLVVIMNNDTGIRKLPFFNNIFSQKTLDGYHDSIFEAYKDVKKFTYRPSSDLGNNYSRGYIYKVLLSQDIITINFFENIDSPDAYEKILLKQDTVLLDRHELKSSKSKYFTIDNIFFSDDDSLLAIKLDGRVQIYDMKKVDKDTNISLINTLVLKNDAFSYCKFSGDSRFLLLFDEYDHCINICGLDTKKIYAPLEIFKDVFIVDVYIYKDNNIQLLARMENQFEKNSRNSIDDHKDYYFFINYNVAEEKSRETIAQTYNFINDTILCFTLDDSVWLENLASRSVRGFKTKMPQVHEIIYTEKEKSYTAVGSAGEIELYDSSFNFIKSRKFFSAGKSSQPQFTKSYKSFFSPAKDRVLLAYTGDEKKTWGLEIYNLNKDTTEAVFENFPGPIFYATFNDKENSVSLIDQNSSLIKWFYKCSKPDDFKDLENVYMAVRRFIKVN